MQGRDTGSRSTPGNDAGGGHNLCKTQSVDSEVTNLSNYTPGGGGGGGGGASSSLGSVLGTLSPAGGESVTSDDPVETTVASERLGRIQFSIAYDFPEMTLTLRIIRAVDLAAKDFSGTSDPYVKIMLLPDKKRKLTTNVKRKNLNPRWNEVFAFEGKHLCRIHSFIHSLCGLFTRTFV